MYREYRTADVADLLQVHFVLHARWGPQRKCQKATIFPFVRAIIRIFRHPYSFVNGITAHEFIVGGKILTLQTTCTTTFAMLQRRRIERLAADRTWRGVGGNFWSREMFTVC